MGVQGHDMHILWVVANLSETIFTTRKTNPFFIFINCQKLVVGNKPVFLQVLSSRFRIDFSKVNMARALGTFSSDLICLA